MDAPRRSRRFQVVLILTLIASVGLLVRTSQREQSVRQSWKDLYGLAMNPHPVRAVLDQPLPDPIELTPQVPSVGTPADAKTGGASG